MFAKNSVLWIAVLALLAILLFVDRTMQQPEPPTKQQTTTIGAGATVGTLDQSEHNETDNSRNVDSNVEVGGTTEGNGLLGRALEAVIERATKAQP